MPQKSEKGRDRENGKAEARSGHNVTASNAHPYPTHTHSAGNAHCSQISFAHISPLCIDEKREKFANVMMLKSVSKYSQPFAMFIFI